MEFRGFTYGLQPKPLSPQSAAASKCGSPNAIVCGMSAAKKNSNLVLAGPAPAQEPVSITDYGRSVILQETQAASELTQRIDDNFRRAVEMIMEMSDRGHVIVSGIGKAGFIAMKISATLASIG